MELKIYAPVDCEIKEIEKCSDKVFASRTLGNGIVIIPKNNLFYSPLDKGTVELIFDTKHAIYFKQDKFNLLLHVGMDTVKLEGKPFEIFIKKDDQISTTNKILSVDLEMLKKENISIETPLMVEETSDYKIDVKILKRTAKAGELIAIFEIKNIKVQDKNDLNIKNITNKFQDTAKEIKTILGDDNNYSSPYNCMTRFRTVIKDKKKVSLSKLKKIALVKDALFQGNELQIIIGGEVVKVVEEFNKLKGFSKKSLDTPNTIINLDKINIGRKILMTITGVISPILGIFIAAGLFAGIYSILSETKVIHQIDDLSKISEHDIFSAIMFVLFKFILSSIGIFFIVSIVKYFDGNIYFALAVGIALTSRGWIPVTEGIKEPELASFGKWINYGGKSGFLLFNIQTLPIVVGSYEGGVLPFITAGAFIIILDKWVGKWISPLVDTIFRGFIVVSLTLIITWFAFGPIMGLVEFGMFKIFSLFEKIPFGIGVGLYAMFWQPLVLTGTHIAISTPIDLSLWQGNASLLYPAYNIAIFTQVGAAIAIAIRTKNFSFKRVAIASTAGSFFGISEPIIYGVTLPKLKPFVIACLVAFPIGVLSGLLKIKLDYPSGWGVFEIVGYETTFKKGQIIVIWILSFSSSLLINFFFYKERKNELKHMKKGINLINKSILFKDKKDKKENYLKLIERFDLELKDILQSKKDYNNYEKYLSQISELELKLKLLEEREQKKKEQLFKKLNHLKTLYDKKQNDKILEKFKTLNNFYNHYNLDLKKEDVRNNISSLQNKNLNFVNALTTKKNKIYSNTITKLKDIGQVKEEFKNIFYNAIYCVEISFQILDQKLEYIKKDVKVNHVK